MFAEIDKLQVHIINSYVLFSPCLIFLIMPISHGFLLGCLVLFLACLLGTLPRVSGV